MGECQKGGCGGHDPQQAMNKQDESVRKSLGKIKKKFLIMSGKGGVGKTSVSVNLAMALAGKGFKVGIMDVDVHGPDVPRMLGLTGIMAQSTGEKLEPLRYSENLSAISIEGIMPNPDSAVIWRGPLKHSAIAQFIGDVDWGELDFLIVDSPPGTGDEPMSVAQMIPEASAIVVTTPQEVALSDVRKSINFCKKVEMEIFGIVENMSGYACPHCGETIDPFGMGGGKKTAEQFDLQFLGRIPFDPELVKAADSGQSYAATHEGSAVTNALQEIADKIVKALE